MKLIYSNEILLFKVRTYIVWYCDSFYFRTEEKPLHDLNPAIFLRRCHRTSLCASFGCHIIFLWLFNLLYCIFQV